MPRCYLTGIEFSLDDAWMLDTMSARRHRLRLLEMVEIIERQIQLLGDPYPGVGTGPDGSPQKAGVRRKKLVCQSVAQDIGECLDCPDLFIRFQDFKERQHLNASERLLKHPLLGKRFGALNGKNRLQVVRLASRVFRKLFPPGSKLSAKANNALAGVCLAMRDESPQTIAETLVAGGLKLTALGITEGEAQALFQKLADAQEGGDE